MYIPKLPFHNVLGDLLYTLLLRGECLKAESISLNDEQTTQLHNIPKGAQYAIMQLEVDPQQGMNRQKAIRYITAQEFISLEDGLLAGDLEKIEIMGIENLTRFRAIGLEHGRQHTLLIHYFG